MDKVVLVAVVGAKVAVVAAASVVEETSVVGAVEKGDKAAQTPS